MKRLLVLGLALLATTAAFAYPSMLGATGTGVLPSAAIATGTELAVDYYLTGDNAPDDTISGRVVFGAGQSFELYANYFGLTNDPSWAVGGKFLLPLGYEGAALALGANYGTGDIYGDEATILQAYLVADFAMAETAKLSLGVNWTQMDFDGGPTFDGFRYFLGLDAALGENAHFVGDIQTSLNAFEPNMMYSAALRYAFTPMISGQIGYSNNLWTTVGWEGAVFAGLNFSFGSMAEE
ncbi:MAG: hypothetical protein ACYC7E_22765 [Armatimonadota bacterium]